MRKLLSGPTRICYGADCALPQNFLVDLIREYLASEADLLISLKQIPYDEIVHRSLIQTDKQGLQDRFLSCLDLLFAQTQS
jgi:hypothetical protein